MSRSVLGYKCVVVNRTASLGCCGLRFSKFNDNRSRKRHSKVAPRPTPLHSQSYCQGRKHASQKLIYPSEVESLLRIYDCDRGRDSRRGRRRYLYNPRCGSNDGRTHFALRLDAKCVLYRARMQRSQDHSNCARFRANLDQFRWATWDK